jgi:outer membrane protein assembly factor BamB
MVKVKIVSSIILVAVILVLIGCGGNNAAITSSSKAPIVGKLMGLPGDLPAPSILREAKAVTSGVFSYGSQYDAALPNQLVTAIDNLLLFEPAWLGDGLNGASFAVYSFNSTGYSTDDMLHLEWQTPGTEIGDLWIGLANFVSDRWDWFAGPVEGKLPYDAAKYNSGGQVYAVVLCLGSDVWKLQSVRICADVPPVVASVSPPECTQGEPVSFTAVLYGTADTYSWSFGGGTDPNTSTASAPAVTPLAPGDYSATLIAANSCGYDKFNFVVHVNAAPVIWNMFGHDLQHTRRSPFTGPATNALKWSYNTGRQIGWSSPAIGVDGTVYIGNFDSKLYAINPDGSLKWTYTTGSPTINSSPAIGTDGTVYVGSFDHNLYAINPDGSLKWNYATGGPVSSSPAVGTDGTVYVGSEDYILYAINPDGSLKWNYTAGDQVRSSPAIGVDGTVYVGCDDQGLYAIYPDGSLKWAFATGATVLSSPAIGEDGTVYAGCESGILHAINPDGSLKWIYNAAQSLTSPAIDTDGTLYMGDNRDKLHAVNPDGSLKWTYTIGATVYSSPALSADGTIYVGGYDTNFYAINPDGSMKWLNTTGGEVYSSPAIGADGTVYVGSSDGQLYAFGPGA